MKIKQEFIPLTINHNLMKLLDREGNAWFIGSELCVNQYATT